MTIDSETLMQFILGPFGVLVVFIIIIVTGFRGDWVFGWYARELRNRITRLENRLDTLTGEVSKTTSLATSTSKINEKVLEGDGSS